MVDLYDGPCREGIRGGLEQFKWDSVKDQVIRDRECYLGQSVKIGIQGKFGRFSTNDWWSSKRPDQTLLAQERDILKRLEEELMLEALGIKPKFFSLLKEGLNDEHKAKLMAMKPNDVNEPDEYVLKKTFSTHKDKRGTDFKRKDDTKCNHYKRQDHTKDICFDNCQDTKLTNCKRRDETGDICCKRQKETRSTHSKRQEETRCTHSKRQEETRSTHSKRQEETRSTHFKGLEETRSTRFKRHADKTFGKGASKSDNHFKESRYYSKEHSFEENLKPQKTEYLSYDTRKSSYRSRSRDHLKNPRKNEDFHSQVYDRRYTNENESHAKKRAFNKKRSHS